MGAHLYVNGKLRLATGLIPMIAPNGAACPAYAGAPRGARPK
ncbi:hypothetical protein SC1_02107 [Sphingopyxis sp. C-1]|nr:hypothetical protein SC1_02107 [Sphingopyxis sp. C-1]